MLLLAGSLSGLIAGRAQAGHAGPFAETAGAGSAAAFSPFADETRDAWDFFLETASAHRYYSPLSLYTDTPGDNDPHGATVDTFLTLPGRGLLYIDTHGGPDNLMVETYADDKERDKQLRAYKKRFREKDSKLRPNDLYGDDCEAALVANPDAKDPRDWAWGICITAAGIARIFDESDSIIHVGACNSSMLATAFDAREYFGYRACILPRTIVCDTHFLWGRMDGEDGGQFRAARSAFDAPGSEDCWEGLFARPFTHYHRPGDPNTVLSPSVLGVSPDGAITGATRGAVRFDTPIVAQDGAGEPVALDKVLTVNGCNAEVSALELNSATGVLSFTITASEPGNATLTVHADKTRAGTNFPNPLDGNTIPANGNHRGPNGDDYTWTVTCEGPQPGPADCESAVPTIVGTDGPDFLAGSDGPDVIDAKGGDDFVSGAGGNDVVIGGAGNDNLVGGGGLGADGEDQVCGGDGNDVLGGSDGADTLTGGEGADLLSGGDGGDTVSGGAGADTLGLGDELGDDKLFGEAGDDFLSGGDGMDSLFGGEDDDLMGGGTGDDHLDAGDGQRFGPVNGGPGDDTINGGGGPDSLFGDEGHDKINGGEGADSLQGDAGDDTIVGGNGADGLYGMSGNDTLDGTDGVANDTLDGGADSDECFGDVISEFERDFVVNCP